MNFVRKINTSQPSIISISLILILAVPHFSTWANDDVASEIKQVVATADKTVYPASFFIQYLPQNALQMIERLPGFNFDEGSNARGFGGNAGNVLIDNARPTSKSGGLRGALTRIPVAQVERIEILRGGVSAGEAAGQSLVANVVRLNNGTSGTWAFKLRRAPDGKIYPNVEAAVATRLGDWDTSFDFDIGGSPGFRSAKVETTDADDDLVSSAKERLTEISKFAFINGEGVRDIANGKLTLNARIGGDRYDGDTTRDIFNGSQPGNGAHDDFWTLNVETELDMAELGIDWNRTVDNWKLRLIGLGLVKDRQFGNQFHFESIANGVVNDSSFVQDSRNTEFIARNTYGKVNGSNFKPEFGIEMAKNKLTSKSESFLDGVLQQLNGGDVAVEEVRGEAFSSFVYEANKKLTIEGGITAEVSKIKVSGDAGQEQTFKFIKPRFSATYKFNEDNQFTLEAERRVGQLDFNDFAASSQASDDRTTSGNPDLAPSKTNEIALTYDWGFSERGSFKVKAFHEWREDILEQILLPSGGQGLGNAGDAHFWGVQTDLNLPLEPILKNGLIEITHFYRDSRFNDPIISDNRTVNGYTPNWLTFKLRQDITKHKIAWGVEYWGSFTDTNFFVDEIQTFSGNNRLRFFVESSPFFDVKIQLEVTNANTADFDRKRLLFEDDRGSDFKGTEIAYRKRRPEIKLTVSSNF